MDNAFINIPGYFYDEGIEVREAKHIDKHEIIVKIADILGSCPSNLKKAEDIFESIKFLMANYVVQHEYKSKNGFDSDFLVWLDSKINPQVAEKLFNFLANYLK